MLSPTTLCKLCFPCRVANTRRSTFSVVVLTAVLRQCSIRSAWRSRFSRLAVCNPPLISRRRKAGRAAICLIARASASASPSRAPTCLQGNMRSRVYVGHRGDVWTPQHSWITLRSFLPLQQLRNEKEHWAAPSSRGVRGSTRPTAKVTSIVAN
jgi:hypothetical protein